MAQSKTVYSLTGQLVQAQCPNITQPELEARTRDASQSISSNNAGRVNQFEVYTRYDGLVEKLRILNRDHVASELEDRTRDLMKCDWKWTPEVLSLLASVSNRPTAPPKSVGDDDSEPGSPEEASLNSYDDASQEDTSLWRNVDFAHDGSDEDNDELELSSLESDWEEHHQTPITDRFEGAIESLVSPVCKLDLKGVMENLSWRWQNSDGCHGDWAEGNAHRAGTLMDVQIMREVIFMLLGLPTAVFTNCHGAFEPSQELMLQQKGQDNNIELLRDFSAIGHDIDTIRLFIRNEEGQPLLQTFQFALEYRLHDVDQKLNAIQQAMINGIVEYVASLLQLHREVYEATYLIRQLATLIRHLSHSIGKDRSFVVLEGLHQAASTAQELGDASSYEYAAEIFFECFTVYLRLVRSWMDTGTLMSHDNALFIKPNELDVPLESIWQSQFFLHVRDNGELYAPNFLHLAANKILNTGKSVDFLTRLGDPKAVIQAPVNEEMEMSFASVCQQNDPYLLSPFAEMLDSRLNEWIGERYRSSSLKLHRHIEEQFGLQRSFDALEYVFFSRDSILSNDVLTLIFDRLDGARRYWDDPLILTELYSRAFSDTSPVDTHNITVSSNRTSSKRSMSVLEHLRVSYTLSWPVANIIRPSTMAIYQRVSGFIMQLHRARFLLQRHKLPHQIEYPSPVGRQWLLRQMYSIRLDLLHFTDTMLTHVMEMVLNVSTSQLRRTIKEAQDIDAMVATHADYIARLEDQCLLVAKHTPLKQAIIALLDLTVHFSDVMRDTEAKDRGAASVIGSQSRDSEGMSSDDDEDDEAESPSSHPRADIEDSGQRITKIQDTFSQLHSFVLATVNGLSKADSAACWEILASGLSAGIPVSAR